MNVCEHNYLDSFDEYAGISVNIKDTRKEKSNSQVCGMFTYKKYICSECQKIITVLNAVVEETD